MKFSANTASILPAFFAAQGSARTPVKNKKAHNYMYADLDEIMGCIREPLKSNGLIMVQSTGYEEAHFGLFTRLIHVKSGEWLESFYELDSDLNPQDQGKENTYFRRYSLQNLFALVAQDDDDAEGVQKNGPKVKTINTFNRGFP